MKIQAAKKCHYDSGPNMTPLVDIVMVILIFLMLAGTFTGAEQYIVSQSPIVKKGAVADYTTTVMPDPPFQIFVNSYGSGYTAYPAGLQKVSDGNALRSELETVRNTLKRGQLNSAGKMIDSTTQIVISPDATVKWQFLIDVYQAALGAGFTKVGFATAR